MSLNDILDSLFPAGHAATVENKVITGEATTAQGTVAVLGTTDAAAIDHAMALALSRFILNTVEQHPGRPLVFLVDTSGQALSRSQELLCLNGSLAHLAQCVDLARRQGHASLSLVTANAVSGGFLSFGLMADQAYALADAQVRVMDLRAMSRVTKIAHERLVELAANSPIFAPGAESYVRMGGIEAIWSAPSAALLESALTGARQAAPASDQRMGEGLVRGGRQLATGIAKAVQRSATGGA
jgi:malonate decarboxylase gamma subunit